MDADITGVLDDLVNQFSDPMSFLRELIQNAIDAGSNDIEVHLEHDPARQLMTVHVDDYGQGMDLEIIETKLTRLFSSGKDDDFTKIGRFGIGFVSVFAISPQVVCVDTGRAGEYWRVIFKPDRTFDLLSLDEPVEGTRVRLYKSATLSEYLDFERRTREVIAYWCRHVDVPIRVQGETINEAFEIASSPCSVSYEEEGTRAVAAWVTDSSRARGGFFNRGLTLKDDVESEWSQVAFKIDSRYLEHTLTRDQVLKDRHYHKAHALLDRLIRQDLVLALFDELEACAERGPDDPEAMKRWGVLAGVMNRWLQGWGELDRGAAQSRRLIPALYEEPLSINTLRQRQERGALYYVSRRTRLSDALKQRFTILALPASARGAFESLALTLCATAPRRLVASWNIALPHAVEASTRAVALRDEVQRALKALGARVERVRVVELEAALLKEAPPAHRLALLIEAIQEPFEPLALAPLDRQRLLNKARLVALRGDFELVQEAIKLAAKEPEWAALLVVKALLLQDPRGMLAEDEAALTSSMVARRAARLKRGRRAPSPAHLKQEAER